MNCLPRYRRCISALTCAVIGIRPHSLPALLVVALLFSRSITSRRVAHCVPHSALFALTPLRFVAGWRALFGGGRLVRSVVSASTHFVITSFGRGALAFAYTSHALRSRLMSSLSRTAPLPFLLGATAPNPADARHFVPRLILNDFKLGLFSKDIRILFLKESLLNRK